MLLLKISLPENCLAAEIHRGERRLPRLPLAGFLKWPIYKKTSGRRHRGPVRAPGFVCLSALEQLFRQLVSSRTVQLSSYQLPGPPVLLLLLSASCSVSALCDDLFPGGFLMAENIGLTRAEPDECPPYGAIGAQRPQCPNHTVTLPFVVFHALLNAFMM